MQRTVAILSALGLAQAAHLGGALDLIRGSNGAGGTLGTPSLLSGMKDALAMPNPHWGTEDYCNLGLAEGAAARTDIGGVPRLNLGGDAGTRCCCNGTTTNPFPPVTRPAGTLGGAATAGITCAAIDLFFCEVKALGESAAGNITTKTGELRGNGDQIWIIIAGALVFFMQCGFAMLEAGSVRRKSTQNIIFKNLCDVAIAAVCFYFIGYGLAYGDVNCPTLDADCDADNFMGRHHNFMLYYEHHTAMSADGTGTLHKWFFQFAFAATAATIVSGAMAERTQILGYICYSVFITIYVYPTVVHWCWSNRGWLSPFASKDDRLGPNGMIDFAGSGIVHMVGGFAALVGAWWVGPRTGRFPSDDDHKKKHGEVDVVDTKAFQGQSTMLACLGTFILWFGWYGFNCGSTLGFSGNLAGKIATTTTLSAATAGVLSTTISYFHLGHWSVSHALNGVLAGLVSITAPCATVDEYCAVLIGAIGALVYYSASLLLVFCKIDDPLGAFPVHGACGVWGCLAVGIFSSVRNFERAYSISSDLANSTEAAALNTDSLDVGTSSASHAFETSAITDGTQFGVQLLGVIVIMAWTVVNCFLLFALLSKLDWLRVSKEDEAAGLDVAEHGVAANDGVSGFFGSLMAAPKPPANNAPDAQE